MTNQEKILERLELVIRKLEELPANADYVQQGWEKDALKYDLGLIGRHIRYARDMVKYSKD